MCAVLFLGAPIVQIVILVGLTIVYTTEEQATVTVVQQRQSHLI